MPEKKNKNTGKKNTGFAFACWLIVAIILLVFFFVHKDTILSNLKNTDFFNRVFGKTPQFVEKHEEQPAPEDNSDSNVIQDSQADAQQQAPAPADAQQPLQIQTQPADDSVQPAETAAPQAEPADTAAQEHETKPDMQKKPQEKPVQPKQNKKPAAAAKKDKSAPASPSATAQLCFVIIDSDGSVSRQIVARKLSKSDSPLSDAIKALLAGPTAAEKSKNCMTLIPPGTRLLGATVKNGIATLNFSEEFEYNSVGVEGYIGQLMQVVYTATSYSTVNSVQFIIEGQREEYLGSEGEWIGSPLSRSSFR